MYVVNVPGKFYGVSWQKTEYICLPPQSKNVYVDSERESMANSIQSCKVSATSFKFCRWL